MPSRRGPRQQQQQKLQQKQEPPKVPGLIRDPLVTAKLMEYVLDGPNGKRMLSRLTRVSKALVEPGLGLLWKELDNLVPLISLFPSHLFKRAKRPGLGLAEAPSPEHWEKVLQYGERVRRLTYDESSKGVSPSIFPIIEQHRPSTYILPGLTTLVWRVETPSGLDHIHLFLNPELQNLTLERLRALQLDLTGRPAKVIDDFFRHVGASSSGVSTPNSSRSRDSGSTKKSKQRTAVEERAPIVGAFVTLRVLQLTGEVPTIVTFLRRIASPLTHLELTDWRNLCVLISRSFGDSLQSLKISANGAARFNDLVRSTSRGEAVSRRLSLEAFTSLPYLNRFEVDLPESVIVQNSDVAQLAEACPSLETLRLCPTARFPIAGGPPSLTLDGLAQLTARCRNLETLAVVLHLGHSWVREPLTAALALSHLAPHADLLRWFHEKNRPGFIETHALGWQRVAEMLPHLQDVRLTERWIAGQAEAPEPRRMADKAVEAKPAAAPKMTSTETQAAPRTVDKVVVARPQVTSAEVDATPALVSQQVDAVPSRVEEGVMASPAVVSREVDAVVETVSQSVDAVPEIGETMYIGDGEDQQQQQQQQQQQRQRSGEIHYIPQIYVPSIVGSAVSLAWRTMLFGPNFVTARMQDVWAMTPFSAPKSAAASVARIHEVVEESETGDGDGDGQHESETCAGANRLVVASSSGRDRGQKRKP
ncbi:hypothetical protein BC826DRAFT_1091501 [Russula brevipes]|nr:hypothetical protein BC826DRAFT_1091501 [Russula brevipes]